MQGLKLLIEEPVYDFDVLIEEKNNKEPSSMYIKGVYLMSEKKNKNGRIYKLDEMQKEVNRYLTEMVKAGRSLGELNHPTSVEVNPERACHMITELRQEGNGFIGKSKILNSPMGHIVRNLILDGVKLGISSRALGKLDNKGDHNDVSDLRLICCDVVHDPSVDSAFVDGILEAKQWILRCDGVICEFVEQSYNKLEQNLQTMPKHDSEEHIKKCLLEFINSLKVN